MSKFRKIFQRSKPREVPIPEARSYDECRKQHSKRLFPMLETLVQTITAKKKRHELDAYKKEDLVFLNEIEYFQDLRSSYPNVEVSVDITNKKVCLKGRAEEFESVCSKCSWTLQTIVEDTLEFDNRRIWDVIADSRVQEHMKNIISSRKIKAQISPSDTSNVVIITALNRVESQKAKNLLSELVVLKDVPIPKDADVSSESEKFTTFLAEQERSKAVKIRFRASDMAVEIDGVADAVSQGVAELEQFFDSTHVKRQVFTAVFRPNVWKFLEINFYELIKPKEEELLKLKISVKLEKQPSGNNRISMTGIEKNFPACTILLKKVFKEIIQKNEKIRSPGLEKLFNRKNGQEELKKIQSSRKVYIEIQPNVIPRSATVSQTQTHGVYDGYNFTTKEGMKMYCGYGRIENEIADVLINSALSDLNIFTACGNALKEKGGPTYTEACKPHKNISDWNIVCTPGGKLACQYVIHAVCCNWNKEDKQGSEKALRDLIIKIFKKCIELGVSSLAMPTIGAGKHGYPEDIVLKIIRKEVENISANAAEKISLKNISVIVFNKKLPNDGGTMPAFRSARQHRHNLCSTVRQSMPPIVSNLQEGLLGAYQPIHELLLQPTQSLLPSQPASPKQPISPITTAGKPRSSSGLKFGSVNVLLQEGDITKQKADVILNVLPKSIKLLDGGGVCQSLLKAGGQIIQDELDGKRQDSTHTSVFITSGGSISNVKNILHFVPTTTDAAGLQASVEQCFHTAQQLSLNHVLIPAIGTASFKIPPRSSADFILEAAKNFSKTNYTLTLEIVVFQKNMLSDFKEAIEANGQNTITIKKDSEVNNNSLTTNGDSKNSDYSNAGTIATAVAPQSEYNSDTTSIGAGDEIQLHFVGFRPNIDDAISDIKAFVDSNKAEKLLENMGNFLHKHKSEVNNLSTVYDVSIKCSVTGELTLKGLREDVADFLVKFTEIQMRYEIEEQHMKWLSELSRYVQWYHLKDDQWVLFDEIINREIETAFREDNNKIDININGEDHHVDLIAMAMKSFVSGLWIDIQRAAHSGNSPDDLPSFWDAQPQGRVVHLVTLLPSSKEYKDIFTHFKTSFKEGNPPVVTKIQRIQNSGLFGTYLAKKKSMEGRENEMNLFHGTAVKNTGAINGNNFNRNFAGINGTKYGQGVYFTNDSSYSLRFCADQHGSRPQWLPGRTTKASPLKSFQMYAVKVLIGDITAGREGLKVPPSRNDPANLNLLFDSVVNDMNNPSIFVIFQDHQCYPEYLITFSHI